MLVLTRRPQKPCGAGLDEIVVHTPQGETIRVVILSRDGNAIRVGIDAPRDFTILRGEINISNTTGQQP